MIPLPTPTQQALMTGDGIEVEDKRGAIRRISGDRLRLMSADTLSAIANKFGGETMADMLYELCGAECVTNGGKKIPDNRTRLAALTLAMAYLVGRPVERSEVVTVNLDADATAGLAERLKNSPALRETFRRILDAAEEGAPSPPPLEAETVSKE